MNGALQFCLSPIYQIVFQFYDIGILCDGEHDPHPDCLVLDLQLDIGAYVVLRP